MAGIPCPVPETPEKRSTTRVYTRQGIEFDRLYLVGGVDDGSTIFKQQYAGGAEPFDADGPLTGIADMVAGSIEAVRRDGAAEITATNVSERGFTGLPGVQFELGAASPTSHRGAGGAFVFEERLYAVVFLAESPDAFERNQASVEQIIDSAIYSIKTIRRN